LVPPRYSENTHAHPLPTVYVIDRPGQGLSLALRDAREYEVELYLTGRAFLEAAKPSRPGCVVVDHQLPDMSGTDLLKRIRAESEIPVIMTAERPDVPDVLQWMRLGATDVCLKPVDAAAFSQLILRTLEQDKRLTGMGHRIEEARRRLAGLTQRQRELFSMFVRGLSQKEIAAALEISPRTVENHRARLNIRLGTCRLTDFYELHVLAGGLTGLCNTCRGVLAPAHDRCPPIVDGTTTCPPT
jgi:FixJ family two-component response regulator